MDGRRSLWVLAGCAALVVGWHAAAVAAPPWTRLLSLRQVEADPQANYRLTEENGPWVIVACTFSGEGAEDQARELVYELRKRYRLPAYVHEMQFDLSDAKGRGIDRRGAPLRMRYQLAKTLDVDALEEVAVLVGDFTGVDDPEAQDALRKLKYSRPKCLELKDGRPTNQSLAAWRLAQKQLQHVIGSKKKEKGPMGHAFVTANPMLPKEYFASRGVDKLVLKMNKDVPHSLLDCPGKYSVQVASFKGQVVIDQREIAAIEAGKESRSTLAEAADKAHRLTEALRLKGYDAYEFHDRCASIVTVGGFNSLGSRLADGRIDMHPQMRAVIERFRANPVTMPGQPSGATAIKSLTVPVSKQKKIRIPFDVQPTPIHVPKRSLGHEMNSGIL